MVSEGQMEVLGPGTARVLIAQAGKKGLEWELGGFGQGTKSQVAGLATGRAGASAEL